MKKDTLAIFGIILLGILMYGLTLRGNLGNPISEDFLNGLDRPTYAFELSPERGRYVHVVALAEHGTYELTRSWADVAYPDTGFTSDGRFYSYFAPGVAYMATPFYLVGKQFGMGQVFTFSIDSIVSIVTLVFIFLIGLRIFALPRWAAFFSVLVYAFASTSWSYAITLYQNAFTTCLVITGFYATWRFSQGNSRYDFLYAGYVWLAYALAITVDYPNVLLMFPVVCYLAYSTFHFEKVKEGYQVAVRYTGILTVLIFLLVTGFHLWHNATYYGGPLKLAGGLKSMNVLIDAERIAVSSTSTLLFESNATTSVSASSTVSDAFNSGTVGSTSIETVPSVQNISAAVQKTPEKNVVGFFHEKKMVNGLYVLLFSDERGLLFFTPVFFAMFFGIGYVLKRKEADNAPYIVSLALIAMNVFLYSSWGDPWGGWAFGPRYLIPSMPWLALLVGFAVLGMKSLWRKAFVYLLFLYSVAVALVGALTSNAIPMKEEGLLLPSRTYNFLLDIEHIYANESGSFVYKTYLANHLSLIHYFYILFGFVALISAVTLFYSSQTLHD